MREALGIVGGSAAHNFAMRFAERSLLDEYRRHRTLIRTLGWIERVAVGSYVSHRVPAVHFR